MQIAKDLTHSRSSMGRERRNGGGYVGTGTDLSRKRRRFLSFIPLDISLRTSADFSEVSPSVIGRGFGIVSWHPVYSTDVKRSRVEKKSL